MKYEINDKVLFVSENGNNIGVGVIQSINQHSLEKTSFLIKITKCCNDSYLEGKSYWFNQNEINYSNPVNKNVDWIPTIGDFVYWDIGISSGTGIIKSRYFNTNKFVVEIKTKSEESFLTIGSCYNFFVSDISLLKRPEMENVTVPLTETNVKKWQEHNVKKYETRYKVGDFVKIKFKLPSCNLEGKLVESLGYENFKVEITKSSSWFFPVGSSTAVFEDEIVSIISTKKTDAKSYKIGDIVQAGHDEIILQGVVTEIVGSYFQIQCSKVIKGSSDWSDWTIGHKYNFNHSEFLRIIPPTEIVDKINPNDLEIGDLVEARSREEVIHGVVSALHNGKTECDITFKKLVSGICTGWVVDRGYWFNTSEITKIVSKKDDKPKIEKTSKIYNWRNLKKGDLIKGFSRDGVFIIGRYHTSLPSPSTTWLHVSNGSDGPIDSKTVELIQKYQPEPGDMVNYKIDDIDPSTSSFKGEGRGKVKEIFPHRKHTVSVEIVTTDFNSVGIRLGDELQFSPNELEFVTKSKTSHRNWQEGDYFRYSTHGGKHNGYCQYVGRNEGSAWLGDAIFEVRLIDKNGNSKIANSGLLKESEMVKI